MVYEVEEKDGCYRVIRGFDIVETFPEWATREEAEEFAARLNGCSQPEVLLVA